MASASRTPHDGADSQRRKSRYSSVTMCAEPASGTTVYLGTRTTAPPVADGETFDAAAPIAALRDGRVRERGVGGSRVKELSKSAITDQWIPAGGARPEGSLRLAE